MNKNNYFHENDINKEFFAPFSKASSIAYVEEVYEVENIFSRITNKPKNSTPIKKEEIDILFSVETIKYLPNELKKIQVCNYPIKEWLEEALKIRSSIKKSLECLIENNKDKKTLIPKKSSSIESLQNIDALKKPTNLRGLNIKLDGLKILVQRMVVTISSKFDRISSRKFSAEKHKTIIEIPEIDVRENTETDQFPERFTTDKGVIMGEELALIVPFGQNMEDTENRLIPNERDSISSD